MGPHPPSDPTFHRTPPSRSCSWGARVRRAAVYQFHAAIAEQWQQGRIFLAGDAAHQTPPFLGQGMNSGMRDVINLAWKLPLVLSGRCAPSLLETYQAERDDHAHDLVSWAVDMGNLMQHLAATEAAAHAGEEPPQMQQTSRKSGYGQGREQPPIRSGVVLSKQVSNDGATGYLLPQPVVRVPEGKEVRFDDLLGARFALLTDGSVSINQKSAALIATLQIQLLDVSTLEMVHGKLPELLQTREALLIRPDRVVFGHTDADVSLDSLLAHFAELLGCPR